MHFSLIYRCEISIALVSDENTVWCVTHAIKSRMPCFFATVTKDSKEMVKSNNYSRIQKRDTWSINIYSDINQLAAEENVPSEINETNEKFSHVIGFLDKRWIDQLARLYFLVVVCLKTLIINHMSSTGTALNMLAIQTSASKRTNQYQFCLINNFFCQSDLTFVGLLCTILSYIIKIFAHERQSILNGCCINFLS